MVLITLVLFRLKVENLRVRTLYLLRAVGSMSAIVLCIEVAFYCSDILLAMAWQRLPSQVPLCVGCMR